MGMERPALLAALLLPSCAAPGVFFSAAAEGSSHNKYLELFNPTCAPVALDGFMARKVSNGGDEWEYDMEFTSGA